MGLKYIQVAMLLCVDISLAIYTMNHAIEVCVGTLECCLHPLAWDDKAKEASLGLVPLLGESKASPSCVSCLI